MAVPSSGEVIAEEIQRTLAETLPREEQGEGIRRFCRAIGEEMATAMRELLDADEAEEG